MFRDHGRRTERFSPSPIHYVIDGKVEKGTMTGSWTHDNRKGDFKITKK